jgi:chitinase
MSAGNAIGWTDNHNQQQITRMPQRFVSDPATPDLIVVGATDFLGRKAIFSMETADMVWAPGETVVSVGANGHLVERDGTSYSAPLVAGLVAYYRSVMLDIDVDELNDPQTVKWLLKGLSRTVQLENQVEQDVEPYEDDEGNKLGRVVPTVWNGQLDGTVSCLRTPDGPGCPEFDAHEGSTIHDLDNTQCPASPVTERRRHLGRRQSGGSCPVTPGGGAGSGGDGGDDGGLRDQLGPDKTVTYHSGTPSPTCTANCGTYCTDFWCRPDRTGEPLHFTDPIHLPATAIPPIIPSTTTTPGSGGDGGGGTTGFPTTPGGGGGGTTGHPTPEISTGPPPALSTATWPTNCISTATWTRCAAPGGGNIVCVATSSCAATATPTPPQPSTHRWVAIHFVELTTSGGTQLSWSRYWSVHEDPSTASPANGTPPRYTGFCDNSSVFEKTDGGASLQSPRYPVDLGSFRAHGRTCRYKSAGRSVLGRVECDGVPEGWLGGCVDVKKLNDPVFGEVRACAPLSNPMFKLVLACSWGEA